MSIKKFHVESKFSRFYEMYAGNPQMEIISCVYETARFSLYHGRQRYFLSVFKAIIN